MQGYMEKEVLGIPAQSRLHKLIPQHFFAWFPGYQGVSGHLWVTSECKTLQEA